MRSSCRMAGRKCKLEKRPKEGLVDSLTKVVRDAAGDLVANALSQLEKESPGSGSTTARLSPTAPQDKGRDSYSSSNRKCFIEQLYVMVAIVY